MFCLFRLIKWDFTLPYSNGTSKVTRTILVSLNQRSLLRECIKEYNYGLIWNPMVKSCRIDHQRFSSRLVFSSGIRNKIFRNLRLNIWKFKCVKEKKKNLKIVTQLSFLSVRKKINGVLLSCKWQSMRIFIDIDSSLRWSLFTFDTYLIAHWNTVV